MATVTHEIITPDTGNTPNASGAFTPVLGDLLVVFTYGSGTVTEDSASMTSSIAGNTFSLVRSASNNTSADRVDCYVANQLIETGEDISQTVTYSPADTATGSVISVLAVAGMNRVGLNAILQSAEQENQAAATPAPAFGSNVLTDNPTLGCVGNLSNPAGMTEPAGWTEGGDSGHGAPTQGLETVFRNSGFTGTTITWGSASATQFASIIIELDTTIPAGGFFPSGNIDGVLNLWKETGII